MDFLVYSPVSFDMGRFVYHQDTELCNALKTPSWYFLTVTTSPHPQPLATADLFPIAVVSSLPAWCINGIIQIVTFWDWLLVLILVPLRFSQVVAWIRVAFFFLLLSNILLRYSLFIHSLVEGHLDGFQFGTIMNKEALNLTCKLL